MRPITEAEANRIGPAIEAFENACQRYGIAFSYEGDVFAYEHAWLEALDAASLTSPGE